MNKYLDIAKKLKALAERGIGGERYNAQKALDRLMKEHSFLKEDLENETRLWKDLHYEVKYKQLLIHVAFSVIGNHAKSFMVYKYRKTKMQFNVTAAEHIEIQAKYDFYKHLYEDELKIFWHGFLLKHDLFNKDKEATYIDDLSPEERERAQRAFNMAHNMQSGHFRKQLNDHLNSD